MAGTGDVSSGNERSDEQSSVRGLVILCMLAVPAGIATGFIGGAFRWCLERAFELRGMFLVWAHTLGSVGWIVPIVAVACGAALAALIVRWAPLSSGSGIQDVEAVSRGEADAPGLRLLPAKFFGGLLSIGSGLVLGREGPTVHMGAALGAEAGRMSKRSDGDVRTLQSALSGAGLAVAFNAPIGGAVFVFEEITKSFRLRTVLPTALGVATAISCSRLILGNQPDFFVRHVPITGIALLPLFIVFGLLTGLLGVGYNKLVMGSLDVADRLASIPLEAKAAVIGGLIGLALFIEPLSAGGGDVLSQLILSGHTFVIPIAILLLAVRFLAGPFSYAATTSGGLFAPLLAVGALWGMLFASIVQLVIPSSDITVATAIVGMAAFFGATVRAPFTGIVLVIEMTATTSVTVPMLIATGCAVLVATLARSTPIYDSLRARMLHPTRRLTP